VPGGVLDQSRCPGPRARRQAAAPNLEHAKATVLEKELAEAVAPNQARERGGRRPGPRARRGRRPRPRARRGHRLRPTARCDATHDKDIGATCLRPRVRSAVPVCHPRRQEAVPPSCQEVGLRILLRATDTLTSKKERLTCWCHAS
jgi:hypothetical protein